MLVAPLCNLNSLCLIPLAPARLSKVGPGPPTSLYKTEQHPQQWDYPNVWPPLVRRDPDPTVEKNRILIRIRPSKKKTDPDPTVEN